MWSGVILNQISSNLQVLLYFQQNHGQTAKVKQSNFNQTLTKIFGLLKSMIQTSQRSLLNACFGNLSAKNTQFITTLSLIGIRMMILFMNSLKKQLLLLLLPCMQVLFWPSSYLE